MTTLSTPQETTDAFKSEVLAGLKSIPKWLAPKFFYDERGSAIFEKICGLAEYYPTRSELEILRKNAEQIAKRLGPDCLLFEFGSGSSKKTRLLLDRMEKISAYLPIDISGDFLSGAANDLRKCYPELAILPICADFTRSLRSFERLFPPSSSRAGFLPGSTLGNFTPDEAADFLRSTAELLGHGGKLLIGIDLIKDRRILEAAYNDALGVTSEFNRNVLHRLKNELGAQIDIGAFEHRAFFNPEESRIEMHLVSKTNQTIVIDGERIGFAAGESIHTENSYKYSPEKFRRLAHSADFEALETWTDPKGYFGVFLLEVQGLSMNSRLAA